MPDRRAEIADLQHRIREAAQMQKRPLSGYERRVLAKLSRESSELATAADVARMQAPRPPLRRPTVHGPAPRDSHSYPASMRPGARGND